MTDVAQHERELSETHGHFFVIVDFTEAGGNRAPQFLLDGRKKPKPYRTAQEARTAAADAPLCRYNPYWIIDMNTGEITQ